MFVESCRVLLLSQTFCIFVCSALFIPDLLMLSCCYATIRAKKIIYVPFYHSINLVPLFYLKKSSLETHLLSSFATKFGYKKNGLNGRKKVAELRFFV